jgi:hypothetical protein
MLSRRFRTHVDDFTLANFTLPPIRKPFHQSLEKLILPPIRKPFHQSLENLILHQYANLPPIRNCDTPNETSWSILTQPMGEHSQLSNLHYHPREARSIFWVLFVRWLLHPAEFEGCKVVVVWCGAHNL